ncbi:hypothetical protein ACH495_29065 [Micromonospora sp. NPDC018662]|uniref:hypothetical protein n=1 Tax=Micromonospora sp. NPDC018662 TaxID=3364238 RepID=UPI0037A33F29
MRIFPVVLACVAVTALGACGGQDTSTNADAAATPTAPAPSASTPSPAASSPAAVTTVSDRELCASAKKTSDEMKAKLVTAMQSGGDTNTQIAKIMTELGQKVSALTRTAGDGEAATALRRFSVEVTKAAAAPDPATAADNPAMAKAGEDFNAACKAAGVTTVF